MVVIDTSVAFKWFNEIEEYRDKAKEILATHLKKSDEIIVPNLLYYELSNAWATKTNLTTEDIIENLSFLKKYALTVAQTDFSHFIKSS